LAVVLVAVPDPSIVKVPASRVYSALMLIDVVPELSFQTPVVVPSDMNFQPEIVPLLTPKVETYPPPHVERTVALLLPPEQVDRLRTARERTIPSSSAFFMCTSKSIHLKICA
jgi:hypothetical protein